MKLAQIIKVLFVVLITNQSVFSQESNAIKEKYTIDNCVNHFELDKAIKNKVGYQY